MTTTFTKGQRVKYIGDWSDGNGIVTFYVQDAVVLSCGKKQMALVDAHTGKPMGRNYKPANEQSGNGCVIEASMADAIKFAQIRAAVARLHAIDDTRGRLGNKAYADGYFAERLANLEANEATVVTPYEPGHKYGPKPGEAVEQHKPQTKGTTYVVRHEGEVVGTRTSHRAYTHAVLCWKAGSDKPFVRSFHGSLAQASKQKPAYYTTASKIVPVEV